MRRPTRALFQILIVGGLLTAVAVVRRRRTTPALDDAPIASTGRGARSAVMARLAARRAADRTWTKARQRLADDEGRRRMQAELERREAQDVVDALGYMKGGMMKLGMQLSNSLKSRITHPLCRVRSTWLAQAPETQTC